MKPLAFVLLFATSAAFAQDKACSPADAATAEKTVDRVVNWEQLYKAHQEFRHCDNGPVSEVFTDALLRLIVEWKQVDGLAKPMEKDAGYKDFVYKHLRDPAAAGDLKSVYSRAKMNCPKGLEGWCDQLAAATRPDTPFGGIQMAPVPTFTEPKK